MGILDRPRAALLEAKRQREAYEKEHPGGLLALWNDVLSAIPDAATYFAHGQRFGTQGAAMDTASIGTMGVNAAQGEGTDFTQIPGTSDYFREQAGVPAPQGLAQNLGWIGGQIAAPGFGEVGMLGKFLPAMFLGARAKTANSAALDLAQSMEKAGASRDDILKTTYEQFGQPWLRGFDGKWKFWAPDNQAEYHPGRAVAEQLDFHKRIVTEAEDSLTLRRAIEQLNYTPEQAKEWFSAVHGRDPMPGTLDLAQVYDSSVLYERLGELYGNPAPSASDLSTRLGKVISNSPALEAYPDILPDLNFRAAKPEELGPGIGGTASLETGIRIRDDLVPMLQTGKNILTHEIQHPIQQIEGFARGGNPAEFARQRDEANNLIDAYNQKMSTAVRNMDAAKARGDAEAAAKWRAVYDNLLDKRDSLVPTAQIDPMETYLNQSGEAEARYSQALHDKDMQFFLDNPPWKTKEQGGVWDVPEDQLITRFSSGRGMLSAGDEYQGLHRPPMRDSGAPGYDLTGGGTVYPDDVYSPDGRMYYGSGQPDLDYETFAIINSMKGRPDREVTIYRAVPYEPTNAEQLAKLEKQRAKFMARGIVPKEWGGSRTSLGDGDGFYEWVSKEIERLKAAPEDARAPIGINQGDWVTINRRYAKEHGESTLKGKYKIVSKKVRARDIYTNGDSPHEWGYDPEPKGMLSADLPMDKASRMKRAEEMGFDTDTVWYHGSGNDIAEFSSERASKRTGNPNAVLGTFMTKDPAEASRYTSPMLSNKPKTQTGAVYPLYVKADKTYRAKYKEMDDLAMELFNNPSDPSKKAREFRENLIADGYDSLVVRIGGQDELVIFDPKNIRSVNAKFDPSKKDSANLLASGAAVAVGAGMLNEREKKKKKGMLN